jgi:deoxyadenosine/deoxycytidine kinase
MILWINGAFGAGKTSTANELVQLLPHARIYDPEQVGYMLRHFLTEPIDDFQDWPPWRQLVVAPPPRSIPTSVASWSRP